MYHIKIDRGSIKKNRDYGRKSMLIAGPKEGKVACEWFPGDEDKTELAYEAFASMEPIAVGGAELIVMSFSIEMPDYRRDDVRIADCQMVSTGPMDPDAVVAAWPYGGKVRAWVVQNNLAIEGDEHEYEYEYEPLTVACDYCGSTFDHSHLRSDGDDDYWSEAVCPVCGAGDCCEIEYEAIQDALTDRPDLTGAN